MVERHKFTRPHQAYWEEVRAKCGMGENDHILDKDRVFNLVQAMQTDLEEVWKSCDGLEQEEALAHSNAFMNKAKGVLHYFYTEHVISSLGRPGGLHPPLNSSESDLLRKALGQKATLKDVDSKALRSMVFV